jgi:hypothetical protein
MHTLRLVAASFLAGLLFALGCESPSPSDATTEAAENGPPSGPAVVDSAIAAQGGATLDRAVVRFTFRGDRYRIRQDAGDFRFQRTTTDSLGRTVREVLSNDSLYRTVDGERVELSEEERLALETTVNSVSYFALLPHPLKDPAVQASYDGRDTVGTEPYHRIRVTFQQEGGGEDWQDVFYYWFHTDTYAMDYLSYAFGLAPGEETGTRFREAFNVRRVEGVRFADYHNYTDTTLAPDEMPRYPELLEEGALELVSDVKIDSVQVRPLRDPS